VGIAQNKKPTTVINDNHGIIIQSVGNNNVNVGAVYGKLEIIKNTFTTSNRYHTIKIDVNTKSYIYLDGKKMGISEVSKPLSVKVTKGQYKIEIQSFFSPKNFLTVFDTVTTSSLSAQYYLDCYFKIDQFLFPVRLEKDGKYGYVNVKTGELALPLRYDEANYFENGIAIVKVDDSYEIIDQNGKSINGKWYDNISAFNKRRAVIERKGLYGLINDDGVELSEIKYNQIDKFIGDLAMVEVDDKVGFIDLNGKERIAPKYSFAKNFDQDCIAVSLGGERNWVISGRKQYERQRNATWGLIDEQGKEILPIIYDEIFFHDIFANTGLLLAVKQNEILNPMDGGYRVGSLVDFAQAASRSNPSMFHASQFEKGGIDLDRIKVKRTGKIIIVHFSPVQLRELTQGGFEGFVPVVTDFRYIKSPFLLLGAVPAKEEGALAKL